MKHGVFGSRAPCDTCRNPALLQGTPHGSEIILQCVQSGFLQSTSLVHSYGTNVAQKFAIGFAHGATPFPKHAKSQTSGPQAGLVIHVRQLVLLHGSTIHRSNAPGSVDETTYLSNMLPCKFVAYIRRWHSPGCLMPHCIRHITLSKPSDVLSQSQKPWVYPLLGLRVPVGSL